MSSPVTITVTSSGGSRSLGLTSPMPRHSISNNPNSPLSGGAGEINRRASSGGHGRYHLSLSQDSTDEFVAYTVHIPPTPDRRTTTSSDSHSSPAKNPNDAQIKDTIYTGGFNSATKAHARKSSEPAPTNAKSKIICGMEGCDEKTTTGRLKNRCHCGFGTCDDCYMDCLKNGEGHCPGCKEPYKEIDGDQSDDGLFSEEKDLANPLPSWGKGAKLEKNFSLVQSMKNPNQDFDHNRWLFETKGTYGYGNAHWPRDGYEFGRGNERYENPPDFSDRRNRPLTRKIGISAAIISPYRLLMVLRFGVLACFLTWRVTHPNHDAMWLWLMSVICEIWFAFSWLLDQLPKLCPVKRVTDLSVLKDRFESSEPNLRNPKSLSDLPGVDIFVSTADPDKEPPLVTANTILSILAADYPVEKLACYLSDDGGSLVTFEALAEAASFSKVWVPFCRKHAIEPRNPEAYFGQRRDPLKNKVRADFVRDRRRVKREYDEFKVRINALPESIRRRSDAYNAQAEVRAKKKQVELGGLDPSETVKVPKATWMGDGSHWHGTWSSGEEGHSRGDHEGIIQIMLVPASNEPFFGEEADDENLIDTTEVDIRLPMLVYVSREKRPAYEHNKKAGAMNSLVRASAIMSNGAFILNLDCDHYVYNSLAIREGMCFMLDRGGDKICYVQFPQRFEGIDPNDRYANHNTVFFDVSMRALDGLQGPMYVGTGCIFRRIALYGFSPPRATEHHGWFGRYKKRKLLRRKSKEEENDDGELLLPINGDHQYEDDDVARAALARQFGSSPSLVDSIRVAEFGGRLLHARAQVILDPTQAASRGTNCPCAITNDV